VFYAFFGHVRNTLVWSTGTFGCHLLSSCTNYTYTKNCELRNRRTVRRRPLRYIDGTNCIRLPVVGGTCACTLLNILFFPECGRIYLSRTVVCSGLLAVDKAWYAWNLKQLKFLKLCEILNARNSTFESGSWGSHGSGYENRRFLAYSVPNTGHHVPEDSIS
jgi:hypothetical protein